MGSPAERQRRRVILTRITWISRIGGERYWGEDVATSDRVGRNSLREFFEIH